MKTTTSVLAVLGAFVIVGLFGTGIWYSMGPSSQSIVEAEAARQAAAAFAPAVAPAQTQPVTQQDAVLNAIANTGVTPAPNTPTTAAAPQAAPATPPAQEKKITSATLRTNKGDISIVFFDGDAPNTVANFIKLAKAGFYNGTKFHRVIKGFMIQGGDPFTKDDSQMARWGQGGPGYAFADEIGANNHNNAGTIAMANSGPNTNGSQFFINVANNNFLDTKHTVFGKVTSGVDVAQGIESTATDASDRPVEPIIVTSVTLQ